MELFPSLCSLSGEEKSDDDLKTLLRGSRRSILAARYHIGGLKRMLRVGTLRCLSTFYIDDGICFGFDIVVLIELSV